MPPYGIDLYGVLVQRGSSHDNAPREGVDVTEGGFRHIKKVKFAFKKLVLSNPNPGECGFPESSILIEPQHLHQDKSRPGDIVALGMGAFLKDTAMDCVIISSLAKSCLSHQAKCSDFSLQQAEKAKFLKDKK
jgi:hypothetical protein